MVGAGSASRRPHDADGPTSTGDPHMSKPMKMLLNGIRLLVVIQIVMGILIWMGKGAEQVNLHMALGMLLAVLVVSFAVMGKAAGAPKSLTWVTIMWAIVTIAVGVEQRRVLAGSSHWVLQLVHRLRGIGMAGQAERMARALKEKLTA